VPRETEQVLPATGSAAAAPQAIAEAQETGPASPATPSEATGKAEPVTAGTAAAHVEQDIPPALIPPPPEAHPRGKLPVLAGAAVVLVALAAGLAAIAGAGDGNQAAPARPSSTASASVPSSGAGIVPPGVQTPSPRAPEPAPQGWQLYREAAGFSVGVPVTWRRTVAGTAVTFTDPSSSRLLRIVQVPNTGADPYDYWLARQATVASRTDGYDFMRIARVMYRGWPTADWEYRTGSGATRAHVLTRIVEPAGPRAYLIHWSTADSRWAADRALFDTFAATFGVGQ
jgi:hypothetical protein